MRKNALHIIELFSTQYAILLYGNDEINMKLNVIKLHTYTHKWAHKAIFYTHIETSPATIYYIGRIEFHLLVKQRIWCNKQAVPGDSNNK